VSYPIDPSKLLRQARALAGIGAGRGRPSPTNHRRAVSSAYYALFHACTLSAARHVLPAAATDDELRRAARWMNHKDIRTVCEAVSACAATTAVLATGATPKGVSSRGEPVWLALSTPVAGGRQSAVQADLEVVADAFTTLQAARHSADYDHLASFPKATTIGYVEDAAEAVRQLDANLADPSFERFLAWIVMRASGFVL
jgi:hypothetical protein